MLQAFIIGGIIGGIAIILEELYGNGIYKEYKKKKTPTIKQR